MRRKNASFWRLVWSALLAAATILNPFLATSAQAAPPGQIVIGEVAWAGSALSTADEWIELWNISDAPVSVGNWYLRGMGENGRLIILPADAVIPARGVYLIANYNANEAKSNLAIQAQVVTTTVSLSNSALRIDLLDSSDNLVDSAGTGGAPPAGSSGTVKISMIRSDTSLTGTMATAWSDQSTGANLKPGSADLGTPGVCDGCSIIQPLTELPPDPEPVTATSVTAEEPPSQPATTTESLTPISEQNPTSTMNPFDDESLQILATSSSGIATDTGAATSTDVSFTAEAASSTATASPISLTATSTAIATSTPFGSDVDIHPQTNLQTATVSDSSTVSMPTAVAVPKPPYGMLRLNEVAPYPASGKEWVEIISLDAANTIPLKGCELHDRQGRIMTVSEVILKPGDNPYVAITLSSSRLNNDGDSVALYCDGRLIDAMGYTATPKGQSWIRFPDKNGTWRLTTTVTPAAQNVATQPAALAAKTNATTTASPAVKTTSAPAATESAPPASAANDDAMISAEDADIFQALDQSSYGIYAPELTAENPPSVRIKTSAKKAIKSIKTSASKKTAAANPIIPYTFDMLDDFDNSSIRVRLEGTVGSTPGLLPYHSFVLLSPEGRGLQVRVPIGKKLPDLNLMVSVTGNLQVDDRGRPYLKMSAKDELALGLPTENIVPRIVDIELPANEDAWAYMSVTGTVKSIKARNITLDLDGVDLVMAIKPSVRYRPQRLAAGDVIRAIGLLDLTGDEPRLLPRSANDIVLLKHAETKPAAAPVTGLTVPGWTPFGAAAGAVALTEGAKHYRKRRQRKMLERKLEELTSATT